jgi:transposase-like protein
MTKKLAMTEAPQFQDDEAAREYLEKVRWGGEPVCPHCGSLGDHYRLEGEAHRKGLFKCQDCRAQFSVTVGTVFERSHIPLHKWLLAAYLLCSSKKGMSSRQLQRTLGVTYKTAWFLSHRIRLAMTGSGGTDLMGSGGDVVEADETYIGRKRGMKKRAGGHHKNMVFALVERGGRVRAKHIIAGKEFNQIKKTLRENVSTEARLATDEARMYWKIGKAYAEHLRVNHSKDEYVRGDASTNTIESFFAVFKRGMKGVYQQCSQEHLKRYLAEFEFRYNNRSALGVEDIERTNNVLENIGGKRLTYRQPISRLVEAQPE